MGRYDDAANGIASHDADGNRQSALSPSAIITERGYEMSLIFRNNAISDEYPEGIFHAHPEYWPVKQEPIGLIEAQGLFILPGRLVDQLGIVEEALAEGRDLPDEVSEFSLEWGELAETLAGNRDREAIHQPYVTSSAASATASSATRPSSSRKPPRKHSSKVLVLPLGETGQVK